MADLDPDDDDGETPGPHRDTLGRLGEGLEVAREATTRATQRVVKVGTRLYQHIVGDIFLFFASFGLLYFLTYFLINSHYARSVFDELVNGRVFRGSITWERLDWGPIPTELRIHRPVLSDSQGKTVVLAEEVEVSVDLLALTEGRIHGSDMVIDTPRVSLREVPFEDAFGRPTTMLNIAAMFMPPTLVPEDGAPATPPTLQFEVREIRNAQYEMDLPTLFVACEGVYAEDAYFDLRPNPAGAGPPLMKIGAHSVESRHADLRVPRSSEGGGGLPASKLPAGEVLRFRSRALAARGFTWDDSAFRVEEVRARLGADKVRLRGFELALEHPGGPVALQLGGQVHVEITDLGRWLDMFGLPGFSGPVVLEGRTSGELFSQSGSFQVTSNALGLPDGTRVTNLRLHARHEDNRLDIQRLSAAVFGGEVEGHAFLDGERGRALVGLNVTDIAVLSLPEARSRLASLPIGEARLSGRIDGRATGLYEPAPTLSSTIDLEVFEAAARAPDAPLARIAASAVYLDRRVDVREAVVSSASDRVWASGSVDFAARTVEAEATVELLGLGRAGGLPGPGRLFGEAGVALTGEVTAKASISGPFDALDGRAEVRGKALHVEHHPVVELQAEARLKRGTLHLARLVLDSAAGHLEASGRAGIFGSDRSIDLTAQLRAVDLAKLDDRLGLTGVVDAHVRARRTVERPRFEVTTTGKGLSYGDYPEVDVRADALIESLSPLRAYVSRFEADTSLGQVRASGAYEGGKDPKVSAAVKLMGVDLGPVSKLLSLASPQPIAGMVSGDLNVEHRLSGGLSGLNVEGDLSIEGPQYGALRLSELKTHARFDGATVSVSDFRLAEHGPELKGGAVIEVRNLQLALADLAFDVDANLKDLPLSWLDQLLPGPVPWPVRGRASLDLRGHGLPQDPTLNGRIYLADAGYAGLGIGSPEVKFGAADRRVHAQGELLRGLMFSLALPTKRGIGKATAVLELTDFSPDAHLPALVEAGVNARLTGRVSGTVDLFADGPLSPVASADLSDVRGTFGRLELANLEPVRLRYVDGALQIDRLELRAAGQKVRIEGRLGLDRSVAARIDGDLDLGLLEAPLSSVFSQIRGQATVALAVNGTLERPNPSGRITLHRLELAPRSSVVGTEIELLAPAEFLVTSSMGPAMSADPDEGKGELWVSLPPTTTAGVDMEARPNRLRLRRDDGQLSISALDVQFRRFLPEVLAVVLDADNVSLVVPAMLRATLAATNLRVSLSDLSRPASSRLFVGGAVHLDRAEYTADIKGTAELNQSVRDNLAGVSRARTLGIFDRVPLLKNLVVDLQIDGENDIVVRNQVTMVSLDLELRPSVRIRGNVYDRPDLRPDERLRLDGEITILPDSSKLLYGGQEFAVKTGEIDFGKGNFLDASLLATRDYKISADPGAAQASGGLGASLASTQEIEVLLDLRYRLPTLDVPAVYALNLSSSNNSLTSLDLASLLLTGTLPAQLSGASSAQPALEAALSPVIGQIEAPLEQTLDVDLTLTPQAGGTLFLGADKNLSRRLRLYSRTPFGENEAAVTRVFGLEYQINNFAFGDLSNESFGLENTTTGRLKFRVELD